jgi:signal transduction histidine kinase
MFKSARIKLTAYYLLIIMLITLSFSTVVYSSTIKQTQRALEMGERRMKNRIYDVANTPLHRWEPLVDEETISELKKAVILNLIVINTVILIGAGLSGYWLAGKTLKPIEQMVEKQKKFTADAAHELKTPLTAIKTNLEVNLRDKKFNLGKAKKIMEDTVGDVDSLTLLTNSLIKQSKYQENKNGEKVVFELKKLAVSVVKKLEPKAKEKRITIGISGDEVEIRANKESISELLTIFVDNAIKFNKEKGSVDIKIERKTDHTVIKISDTGFGIDEKDLPHVFDRFYKAETSRSKTQSDGFGLGLSIAKEIAESHEGKISVKSKKGEGTEFTIKMPV